MISYIREQLDWLYLPQIHFIDIVEILLLALLLYQLMKWIQNTKAWMLLRGILMLGIFVLLAAIFRMNTILWLIKNGISIFVMIVVVVFQPELRRLLEKLGERNFFGTFFVFDRKNEELRFTSETLHAIVTATEVMAENQTGALIVVEREILLKEYEETGISLDSLVSSQLLINIFENKTPLHDGAVIMRGDRVAAATCYLPISANMEVSKDLGTRHRAAIGMSEVSDSLVIVVSEETGEISLAQWGRLKRNITRDELTQALTELRKKSERGLQILPAQRKGEGDEEASE